MSRKILSILVLLAPLLLLPAPAQENAPPAATQKPATAPAPTTPAKPTPAEPAAGAEEADVPPDLGENVSADNSVSFPVDI